MIVGAVAALVVIAGAIAWTRSGNDSPSRDEEFVAAVRQAAPDTTSTLTDADILDSGRANCEMAKKGTLATKIAEAEQTAAQLDVAPGEMTDRMTLPLTYLCPEYANTVKDATSTSATAAPTVASSTTSTTASATPTDGPVLTPTGIGDARLGGNYEQSIASMRELLAEPSPPTEWPKGRSDSDGYVVCPPGSSGAQWSDRGVGVQSSNGKTIAYIAIWNGDRDRGEQILTSGGLAIGDRFDTARAAYAGTIEVTDEGDTSGEVPLLAQFTVTSGPDTGINGSYDPESQEISWLSIGTEPCTYSE
jgi:hypothetical protein